MPRGGDGNPSAERQLALLSWLFKCHRNSFLAVSDIPGNRPEWAQEAGFARIRIQYEPRCMAVSIDGLLVAVGTKAGAVHVAAWDRNGRRWQDCVAPPGQITEAAPRAIRGITVLDSRTVAAGWGRGCYRIVELFATGPLGVLKVHDIAPAGKPQANAGMERFNGMVRLFPAGRRPERGPLALGLSLGLVRLHVLRRTSTGYEVASHEIEELVPSWQKVWGQPVAGGWSHDLLWILTSKGRIACYEQSSEIPPDGSPRLPLRAIGDQPFAIQTPKPTTFWGLDGCVMGLAVQASDAVTFLRFREESGAGPGLGQAPTRWFPVPDALDCTVCLPFYAAQKPPAALHIDVKSTNPVWTVVSRGKKELRWVSWPYQGEPAEAPGRFVDCTV